MRTRWKSCRAIKKRGQEVQSQTSQMGRGTCKMNQIADFSAKYLKSISMQSVLTLRGGQIILLALGDVAGEASQTSLEISSRE